MRSLAWGVLQGFYLKHEHSVCKGAAGHFERARAPAWVSTTPGTGGDTGTGRPTCLDNQAGLAYTPPSSFHARMSSGPPAAAVPCRMRPLDAGSLVPAA